MTLEIHTSRLLLREWKAEDLIFFANMSSDPRVMEFFPKTLTKEESAQYIAKMKAHQEAHGFCIWAVELKSRNEFIGCVGLNVPDFQTPFTPCVEVGWRIAFEHWNKGYATEAANASLKFGFKEKTLREIVAFTFHKNMRSRHVMEKLGMHCDSKDDFNHPRLEDGHPLSRHVLYRISG